MPAITGTLLWFCRSLNVISTDCILCFVGHCIYSPSSAYLHNISFSFLTQVCYPRPFWNWFCLYSGSHKIMNGILWNFSTTRRLIQHKHLITWNLINMRIHIPLQPHSVYNSILYSVYHFVHWLCRCEDYGIRLYMLYLLLAATHQYYMTNTLLLWELSTNSKKL